MHTYAHTDTHTHTQYTHAHITVHEHIAEINQPLRAAVNTHTPTPNGGPAA